MLRCLLVLLFGLIAGEAWAHPISQSSAIINVKADVIEVEIDIMLEDLVSITS